VTRSRILVAVVAVTGLLVVSACAAETYSNSAKDYIPSDIEGRKVEVSGRVAKSIENTLITPEITEFASGTVENTDRGKPFPQLVVLAAKGTGSGVGDIDSKLEKSLTAAKGKVEETKIDGVEVRTVSFSQNGTPVSIAFASPREGLALVAYAFEGGASRAHTAMEALLEAGKR
jgi:hypothetical protein